VCYTLHLSTLLGVRFPVVSVQKFLSVKIKKANNQLRRAIPDYDTLEFCFEFLEEEYAALAFEHGECGTVSCSPLKSVLLDALCYLTILGRVFLTET